MAASMFRSEQQIQNVAACLLSLLEGPDRRYQADVVRLTRRPLVDWIDQLETEAPAGPEPGRPEPKLSGANV